jgi:hypothetical protein
MAKLADQKLETMGGQRVHTLGLGDDDANLEDDFITWKEAFWAAVCSRLNIEASNEEFNTRQYEHKVRGLGEGGADSVVDPHHLDADPDPTFRHDSNPYPDPSFKKGSNPGKSAKIGAYSLFHTFWLNMCKLMRIRIRFLIQLMNFDADPDADLDPDADPGYQNDADPCGYGSKKLGGMFFSHFVCNRNDFLLWTCFMGNKTFCSRHVCGNIVKMNKSGC